MKSITVIVLAWVPALLIGLISVDNFDRILKMNSVINKMNSTINELNEIAIANAILIDSLEYDLEDNVDFVENSLTTLITPSINNMNATINDTKKGLGAVGFVITCFGFLGLSALMEIFDHHLNTVTRSLHTRVCKKSGHFGDTFQFDNNGWLDNCTSMSSALIVGYCMFQYYVFGKQYIYFTDIDRWILPEPLADGLKFTVWMLHWIFFTAASVCVAAALIKVFS